jgi:hypothetical protein
LLFFVFSLGISNAPSSVALLREVFFRLCFVADPRGRRKSYWGYYKLYPE